MQRHLCRACAKSYSEQSALLVRGSWYAREVHRSAVDHWQHRRMSLRRTAEFMRSWLGRQERWRLWRPVAPTPPGEACIWPPVRSIAGWFAPAWRRRPRSRAIAGSCPECRSGDGWPLGPVAQRRNPVVLLFADSVTGLLWPPVVAAREDRPRPGNASLSGPAKRAWTGKACAA